MEWIWHLLAFLGPVSTAITGWLGKAYLTLNNRVVALEAVSEERAKNNDTAVSELKEMLRESERRQIGAMKDLEHRQTEVAQTQDRRQVEVASKLEILLRIEEALKGIDKRLDNVEVRIGDHIAGPVTPIKRRRARAK
jgi:predicted Zn-dependent protease